MNRAEREKLSAHCLELAAALERGETPAFEGISAQLPRDPAKIRKFARNIFGEGARESELIARHLLLHQELIPTATLEQMAAAARSRHHPAVVLTITSRWKGGRPSFPAAPD